MSSETPPQVSETDEVLEDWMGGDDDFEEGEIDDNFEGELAAIVVGECSNGKSQDDKDELKLSEDEDDENEKKESDDEEMTQIPQDVLADDSLTGGEGEDQDDDKVVRDSGSDDEKSKEDKERSKKSENDNGDEESSMPLPDPSEESEEVLMEGSWAGTGGEVFVEGVDDDSVESEGNKVGGSGDEKIKEDKEGSTKSGDEDDDDNEKKESEDEDNEEDPKKSTESEEILLDESSGTGTGGKDVVEGEDDDDDDVVIEGEKIVGSGDDKSKEDDKGSSKKSGDEDNEKKESDDEESTMPMIRMNSSIFESQQEEDEEEEEGEINDSAMDPELIQNMMEFEMDEGESDGNILQGILKKKGRASTDSTPERRVLPRRAAAQAAANTIKEISNLELDEPSENDPEYLGTESRAGTTSTSSDTERHRCHHCKKMGSSLIVVRQYGTDIHLCSNSCFNSFRSPDPTKRPLPCAKCGILNRNSDSSTVMYWETMNFCSDLCVGNFQLEIGSKCSTCVKRVAWQSLGKYCVRFGSDIRQFCSAQCLESYKKNARVCFHCQLDIKRLGNVVMASIPTKPSPKEFCGQDCVEMYIEQNHHQNRVKPTPLITCCICSMIKPMDKELVISPSIYQICGDKCWKQLLESQAIKTATKCETCPKYINMEYIKPAFYVATQLKVHGFCSATCKNVYVLKHREILSCTNCKVKKYNYDLIQSVTGPVVNFAVCSLNCMPSPSQFILNLKDTLNPPKSASDIFGRPVDSGTPIISSVTSMSTSHQNGFGDGQIQISSVSSLADVTSIGLERSDMTNGNFRFADTSTNVTLRQANEDDIIEIRDEDNDIISIRGPHENGIDDDIAEEEVGIVALNDARWISSDISITVGKPPITYRNKSTSARPVRITKETQSDSEELWAMPQVDMKAPPVEKTIYVPVPIPYPVYLPYPFYGFDKPIPYPFLMGVPIPIPIPIDTRFMEEKTETPAKTDEKTETGTLETPLVEPETVTGHAEDEVENMEVDEKNEDDES